MKTMENKKILLGILVIALVLGMTVIGCDEEEDDEINAEKTLIIEDIPIRFLDNIDEEYPIYAQAGLVKIGTSLEDANNAHKPDEDGQTHPENDFIATSKVFENDVTKGNSTYTLSIPLYNPDGNAKWTGNGVYDIYVHIEGVDTYKASSINFSSANTTVLFNDLKEDVSPPLVIEF
jgi:hypothetical protein